MLALVAATAAGYGVFLVYTAMTLGWTGVGPGRPRTGTPRLAAVPRGAWLDQAGLHDVNNREFVLVVSVVGCVAGALTYVIFGGFLPALVAALLAAASPPAAYRSRRQRRRCDAGQAWPRLIEEIRVRTGSAGRSVPQALFEAGSNAPPALRPAFAAAERHWLLTTDFEATVALLKTRLADPSADAALETLLVAHELGGTDLDRRLLALAEDRVEDLHGRKDAQARQAGVRFARRFVLVVPCGMALAGMSIGNGQDAYRSLVGQLAVATALFLLTACWWWAGRLMRLPEEERVFAAAPSGAT